MTANLHTWDSTCHLSSFMEGTAPTFERQHYDSHGLEQKTRAQIIQESVVKTEEKEGSFFSKYWWHILIGFVLIQSMTGGGEEGAKAPAK